MSEALMIVVCWVALAADESGTARTADAVTGDSSLHVHEIESPYQSGRTAISVLCPDRLESDHRYPAVYILPVEARREDRYGSGLTEARQRNLHNRHRAIFVAPTFSHLPWYADHATDPHIRQETYLLKVVVPFVEEHYPVQTDASGRRLLGFSKSGWGAFSLLLRHPQTFGRAAAWDAPLMKDKPDQFGMGEIFGTQANFERYEISRLLSQRAEELRGEKRLILTGYGNFRQHHQQIHEAMIRLGVVHEYRDGPQRGHDWHSGWVEEAVDLLFEAQPGGGHTSLK